MAFARRESTVITAAKKYQAPKDERAQAKGQCHFQKKVLQLSESNLVSRSLSVRDVMIRY